MLDGSVDRAPQVWSLLKQGEPSSGLRTASGSFLGVRLLLAKLSLTIISDLESFISIIMKIKVKQTIKHEELFKKVSRVVKPGWGYIDLSTTSN